jgi:eukaryotic-like serine/threonine-protein kinase
MADLSPDRWHFVSPYLDQAMELPEAARAAWLAQVRSRDPRLADDLEALLDERVQARRDGFLEGTPPAPDAAPPLAGQKVDDWTLMSLIGQGGMGNVWLARRDDGRFEGRAAVKLLNASLVGRAGEERFRREGNILARLADPHIARLLDAGVSPSGQPYLVLEYVEGEPIDRHCDARSLGVEARLLLFLEVLEAVAHAHANLIVHRDIKPSNVMVGQDGRAKLLDFGIAKLLEGEGEGGAATALTREAGRALTPEFAAPEQMTGGAVTTATDVYALGILLYLLLTGRHPAGAALHSPGELMKALLETDPSRLSDAVSESRTQTTETRQQNAVARSTTPDGLRRQLEGDLDTIVAKALKKNPAERYPSVAALADDLRRYLGHEPISARPDTLAYRSAKFVRRHPGGVAAAVVALAATLAGTVVIAGKEREARRQRDAAQAQLARATAANEFLGFLLTAAAPAGQKISASDLLQQGEALVDKQFADNDALRSEMLATIGERYNNAENWEKAASVLERAARLARDPGIRARALCPLALARMATGDRKAATAIMADALGHLPDEPQYALQRAACYCRFSEFGYFTDEPEPMIRNAQTSLAALDAASVLSKPQRIDAEAALAYGYYLARDSAKADQTYTELMAALENAGRDRTLAAADTLNNWALVYYDSSPVRAEPLCRRSVDLHRAIEGPEGVTPNALLNYAAVLSQLARYDEARPLFVETIRTAHARSDAAVEADAMTELATMDAERNAIPQAVAELDEVERTFSASPLFAARRRANDAYARGLVALATGDAVTARRRFSDALGQLATLEAKFNLGVFANVGLARAEQTLGHAVEAETAARQALALAESFAPKGTPSYLIGHARLAVGEVELARGDRAAARTTIAAATDSLRLSLGAEHPAAVRARKLAETAASAP